MDYRIDTGCLQYFIYIDTLFYSPCTKLVDMTEHQTVGMLVITAKHYFIRVIIQQIDQCFKVFRSAALPYKDLHAIIQLIQRFFFSKTFMVRRNSNIRSLQSPSFGGVWGGPGPPRFNILPRILTSQSRSMTIYGLTQSMRRRDLFHYFLIFEQYTRK